MSDSSDLKSLVDAVFDAWSSEDPDRVAERFHEDAVFVDSVNGRFEGREAIRAFYAGSLDAWESQRSRATRVWVDGDTAACVWEMTGRMRGERFGEALAGREARIEGMAWMTFRDGLVVRDEEYFDRQAPFASVGATPPAPSPAA
jgi:uncharacterized protein (TIGR02246 family)